MPRFDDEDKTHAMGEGRCIRESEKAILVRIDDKETWIPKSVVHDDSDVWKKDDEGKIVVKLWWAEKNGHA